MANTTAFRIEYSGLRELLQSLSVVDQNLFQTIMNALFDIGENVRVQGKKDFIEYGSLSPTGGPSSSKRQASFVKSADGFDTRVRPMTSSMAVVSVGQKRRKSRDIPKRRPNFGDLQMRHGLLQARAEKLAESAETLDVEVAGLLHQHGL